MDLGGTIYRLRTEHNLSQGDLAEALGVSRQSVSKWETGGSVPDLDKLVKLSQLFGVSLDELVLDRKPPYEEAPPQEAPQEAPPPVTVVVQRERTPGRKVAGVVLLCMAFLVLLLLTAMGGLLTGLVLALPFLLCAAICFLARRRPGLWCAGVHWAVTPLSALQDLLALYLAAAVVTGAVRMWRTRRTEKSENQ